MKRIHIVIPSFNRAASVVAAHAVTADALCVPESQADEYRKYKYPVEIVTHPDGIKGIALKRQWICDKFGDVFQVDDDVRCFTRMYIPTYRRDARMSPEDAREVIQATYETAIDMGAYIFSLAPNGDARTFEPMKPLRVTGHINGAGFGLRAGSKLRFDPRAVGVGDHVITGTNAYFHRYLLRDDRYGIQVKTTFTGKGGLSGIRSSVTEQADNELLKKLFGDAVRFEYKSRGNRGTTAKTPSPRVIDIPF